uniref:Uncharacterized protein n=1 Tax=viral metagenome TaxID=1070528 RepID=A0A6C0JY37_9ZZZZ
MRKRVDKSSDGKYHINGTAFDELIGTRAKVLHGTAYKTSGGLTKHDIRVNKKTGRIVSKKRSDEARKSRRLEKAGYKPKKGKFVLMRKTIRRTRK